MSHRWEYEDEYLSLKSAFRKAQKEGDFELCEALRPRIAELDGMMWRSKVERFADLAPYNTVVEALQKTAHLLGIPFPDVDNPNYRTGNGQFSFGISDDIRTVQIWPFEDHGYYSVEVFDYLGDQVEHCYRSNTTSLKQATIVLSRWFVERCTIDELHAQCPWMPSEPFQLDGPRLTIGP